MAEAALSILVAVADSLPRKSRRDRRGVLIRLFPRGEATVHEVAPFVRR